MSQACCGYTLRAAAVQIASDPTENLTVVSIGIVGISGVIPAATLLQYRLFAVVIRAGCRCEPMLLYVILDYRTGSPLIDSSTDCSIWPRANWQIDEKLLPRATDRQSPTRIVYCSPPGSPRTATHIAKLLPGDATEELWHAFERHAYLAVRLSAPKYRSSWKLTLADWCLTTPWAMLVYPRLQGSRLDDWANEQPQWVAQSVWVEFACQILAQLEALHGLGYVHGRICPEHLWVEPGGQIHLLGLGQCKMVGQPLAILSPAGWRSNPFDAPELFFADGEATSAQDIYSVAAIIDVISGGAFTKTPVGKCMQAAYPYDRPTAGELLELFRSYQSELSGSFHAPQARAA